MEFQLPFHILPCSNKIGYHHAVYLTGSCFTEHISNYFKRNKFSVKENSHGILFNPISVCDALCEVIEKKEYVENDLFLLNEYWHSWNHHSDFSDLDKLHTLKKINDCIELHHHFLKNCSHLIMTFGSAFAYYLIDQNRYVSNNHRAPHQWFRKDLLSCEQILDAIKKVQKMMNDFNPSCQIIFTISPVRHIRDGVVDNNRSKARLIDAVHSVEGAYYFPAYELVVDVLRDYRFYDADLVHPNYLATRYVWEKFVEACVHQDCSVMMQQMEDVYKAFHHKPKDARSEAHQLFLKEYANKVKLLKQAMPHLDFREEESYFSIGENKSSSD